jgi:hypothetical protein
MKQYVVGLCQNMNKTSDATRDWAREVSGYACRVDVFAGPSPNHQTPSFVCYMASKSI